MINGVSISQIQSISQTHMSHYRRISQVQNSKYSRFSILDPQLSKVLNQKKAFHQKWKKYHHSRNTTELQKGNDYFQRKLDKIKLGKSIYTIDRKNSPLHSKGSNFYNRKKKLELIQSANPSIAKKIINAKGTFNNLNQSTQYSKYRDTVHRLQRFGTFQRMASFSQRKSRVRTEGDTINRERSLSPMSPQTQKKLSKLKKEQIKLIKL